MAPLSRVLLAILIATAVSCRAGSDSGKSEDEASDENVCGPKPSQCIWGELPSGSERECGDTLCGEFYDCRCDPAQARWEETVYDCWCDTLPCDPVTQSGCEMSEKCGQLVEHEDPFLDRVVCLPAGTVPEDGACVRGEAGENGYDNCSAGLHCSGGVCTRICGINADEVCRDGAEDAGTAQTCTFVEGAFTENVGLCL